MGPARSEREGDRRLRRWATAWWAAESTERRARAVAVGAVVAGLLVRAMWAWWAARQPVGDHDPSTYLGLAERLADGQGYVGPTGAPTAYFPPGYPAALAALFWLMSAVGVDGGHVAAAAVLNVVLGGATVALLALLARRLFDWRVAAATAVVLALLPSLVGFSSLVLSEPLFLFLVALALLVALWAPLRAERLVVGRLSVAGLLLGAALLVRPQGALVVVAVLVPVVAAGGGTRLVLARGGAFVAAVAVVLVPWAVRNAVVLDTGLTLSTNTGDNLCIGNNPDANGTLGLFDPCFAELPDQDGSADRAEVARAEATQERAIEWIKGNLSAQPRLLVDRTLSTFEHGHYFRIASQSYGEDHWFSFEVERRLDLLGDIGWFAVLTLGMCGLPALWHRPNRRGQALLWSIVGLAVVSWPFFGITRFGLPSVVLLAVPAGVVLAGLPGTWARWGRTRPGEPAAQRPTADPS